MLDRFLKAEDLTGSRERPKNDVENRFKKKLRPPELLRRTSTCGLYIGRDS